MLQRVVADGEQRQSTFDRRRRLDCALLSERDYDHRDRLKHRRTSRVSTRHLHDVPVASGRDWNLDLLARGYQILLE